MSAQGSSHSVWTYADELLHPRGKGGKFAHKPGGGKSDVKLRGGAVISGVQFDDKGNGHVYLGSGLHTHFHPNGTSTTHTHKPTGDPVADKGNYPHFHSEGSGSQARADAVISPPADAPDPAEPPHSFEPGVYEMSTGEGTLEVFDDGSAMVTPKEGSAFTLPNVDDLDPAGYIPKVGPAVPLADALSAFHGPAASAPAKAPNPNGFAATHDDLTTDTAIGQVGEGDIWIKDGAQAFLITSAEVDPPNGGMLKGKPIRDNGEIAPGDEQELASFDQADENDFLLAVIPLDSPDYPLDPQVLLDAGLSETPPDPNVSGLTDTHHGPETVGAGEVLLSNGQIAKVGHYSEVPGHQEGFTLWEDGSATWDDGTPMLDFYVPQAVGSKQPEPPAPADPNVGTSLADDAPAGIYGKPGVPGKIVKYDDGWALMKANGNIGPKKTLGTLGPSGPGSAQQWKYEKPLPKPVAIDDEPLTSVQLFNAGMPVKPNGQLVVPGEHFTRTDGATLSISDDGSGTFNDGSGPVEMTQADVEKLINSTEDGTWLSNKDKPAAPAPKAAAAYAPPPYAPAWGTDVYKHPAGGTIYVTDGIVEAWDKHGKKKATSATAQKLAEGHGLWAWTPNQQWADPHPNFDKGMKPAPTPPATDEALPSWEQELIYGAAAAPSPEPHIPGSLDAWGNEITPPAPGSVWVNKDGTKVLSVGDDGLGEVLTPGSGDFNAKPVNADFVTHAVSTGWHQIPDADAAKPEVGSVWLQKYTGAVLKVNPDGSADWTGYSEGDHVDDASFATGNGNWIPLPANHPLALDDEPGPPTERITDVWKHDSGSQFILYSNGTGIFISGNGDQTPYDEDLSSSQQSIIAGGHGWTHTQSAKTPNGFVPGIYKVVDSGDIAGLPLQINPDGSGAWLYSQHPIGGIGKDHPLAASTLSSLAGSSYVFDKDPTTGKPTSESSAAASYLYLDSGDTLILHADGSGSIIDLSSGQVVNELSPADTQGVLADESNPAVHADADIAQQKLDAAMGKQNQEALAQVATEFEAPVEHVAPNGAVVGTYTNDYGSKLVVHEDGSGTSTTATGAVEQWDADSVVHLIGSGSWIDASGQSASLYETSPKTEPATTEAAHPNAPTELVELAAMLDYPPNYAWPIVAGAPPATAVAGGSKPIKGASLRAGDVIKNPFAPQGDPISVVKTKKEGGATKVWYLSSGGSTDWFILQSNETADAIARTPHPQITAQAKKAKALLADGNYVPEVPANAPEPPKVEVPVGKYVNTIGTVMTVHADGTATLDYPDTGSTSQTVQPEIVQSLWTTHGAGWTEKVSVTPTGPVLKHQVKEAAKPKSWNSTLLVAGATILLPKGGSMVITSKGYEPGKGYVIHGTPSKDAHPDYLTETDAVLKVTGGTVQFVPKVAINKYGFNYSWTPTPSSSPITDVPPVQSVSEQAAGVLPSPPTLTTVGWTQTGTQAGSNLGGLFTTPAGQEFYVKKPVDQLHVENEVLANRLYAASGVKVPVVSFATLEPSVLGGGKGLASAKVPGKKNLATKYSNPAYRAKLYDGFAIHAWLANWDAVGTGKDNIIEGTDGDPVMVDGGGSMLFRAMGTPKGKDWGPKVTEDKTLRSGAAKDSTDVFGAMTDAQVKASIEKHLAPLLPEQIDALVKSTMTSDPTAAAELAETLKARRLDLLKRYKVTPPETIVPAHPVVSVPGGVLVPATLGKDVASEEVSLGGKDVWFHTTTVPATQVPVGAVLFLISKPEAPWVVTKHAPNSNGKMGLWGKLNGQGEEQWLLQEVSQSEGERKVRCQIAPPAGWKPPPPPPPAVPGVKLKPRANKKGSAGSTTGATSKLQSLNNSLNTKSSLSSAFKRATPEMMAQLSAVGLGSASAFADHFGTLSANWNGSCAAHINVLAMHHAIAMEFGLEGTAPWPNELKNMTTKSQVQKYYAKWGKAYQAAARLIWMETQEQLKAKGIDYVGVSRGFGFVAPDAPGAGQGSISNFGGNVPAPPWAWKNGTRDDVVLRPLSSFSFTSPIGHTRISAEVPRELIFSLNATGFGTSGETEVVILGGAGQEWTISGAIGPKGASFKPEDYYVKFPEWLPGSYQLKKADGEAMNVYPCIETEDYHKAFLPWPFVDADGDDVDTYAEFKDLFPSVDPVELLGLPVGLTMPQKLKDELEALRDSEGYEPDPPLVGDNDMRYPDLAPSRIHDTTDGSLETKASAPDFSSGVMVCLRPVGKAHDRLEAAATAAAAEDLHVTLAYLGKQDALTDADVARLRAAVAGFASVHAPIRGEIAGVARFSDNGDGVPTVALVDSPALPDFRAELVEALAGLPVSTTHGFTPHITLGYDVDGDPGEEVNGIPLVFSQIHLVIGQDEDSYDLTAPAAQTKAFDLEDIDGWVGLV